MGRDMVMVLALFLVILAPHECEECKASHTLTETIDSVFIDGLEAEDLLMAVSVLRRSEMSDESGAKIWQDRENAWGFFPKPERLAAFTVCRSAESWQRQSNGNCSKLDEFSGRRFFSGDASADCWPLFKTCLRKAVQAFSRRNGAGSDDGIDDIDEIDELDIWVKSEVSDETEETRAIWHHPLVPSLTLQKLGEHLFRLPSCRKRIVLESLNLQCYTTSFTLYQYTSFTTSFSSNLPRQCSLVDAHVSSCRAAASARALPVDHALLPHTPTAVRLGRGRGH
jgi:hypothetical protein